MITRTYILKRLTEIEKQSQRIEIRKIKKWDRKTAVWYLVGTGKDKKYKFRLLET